MADKDVPRVRCKDYMCRKVYWCAVEDVVWVDEGAEEENCVVGGELLLNQLAARP